MSKTLFGETFRPSTENLGYIDVGIKDLDSPMVISKETYRLLEGMPRIWRHYLVGAKLETHAFNWSSSSEHYQDERTRAIQVLRQQGYIDRLGKAVSLTRLNWGRIKTICEQYNQDVEAQLSHTLTQLCDLICQGKYLQAKNAIEVISTQWDIYPLIDDLRTSIKEILPFLESLFDHNIEPEMYAQCVYDGQEQAQKFTQFLIRLYNPEKVTNVDTIINQHLDQPRLHILVFVPNYGAQMCEINNKGGVQFLHTQIDTGSATSFSSNGTVDFSFPPMCLPIFEHYDLPLSSIRGLKGIYLNEYFPEYDGVNSLFVSANRYREFMEEVRDIISRDNAEVEPFVTQQLTPAVM
jgi:hypothetical protein